MSQDNPAPQEKLPNGRYRGTNYRYSSRTIKIVTRILIAYIFVGTGLGLGLGSLGDSIYQNTEVPAWYTILCIGLALSGVGLPLLVAAWLGASALNKYAGPVGLLLFLGIISTAIGKAMGLPLWFWLGIVTMAISVLLFFVIGARAKVAMWLQLPILSSPRFYLRHGPSGSGENKEPKHRIFNPEDKS